MNTEEIIDMARQVGVHEHGPLTRNWRFELSKLEAFAKLVDAKATSREREACAKTVEDMAGYRGGVNDDGQAWMVRTTKYDCAKAIRNRGDL